MTADLCKGCQVDSGGASCEAKLDCGQVAAYLDLLEEFWKTWMVERKYIGEEAVLKLEKLLKDAGRLK